MGAGTNTSCAVDDAQAVSCWGTSDGIATTPSGTFTAVSVGWHEACALGTGGELSCWGTTGSDVAGAEPSGTGWQALHVSTWDNACAIDGSGALHCWGDDAAITGAPPTGHAFVEVAVGGSHACAITDADEALCWGDNDDDQLDIPGAR